MAIGRGNVRYYHGSDRDAAGALSALVGSMLPGGTAPDPRDFTDYATPTAPGKVAIWLAGEPDSARTAVAPAPDEAPRIPAEPPLQSQAEAVERQSSSNGSGSSRADVGLLGHRTTIAAAASADIGRQRQ